LPTFHFRQPFSFAYRFSHYGHFDIAIVYLFSISLQIIEPPRYWLAAFTHTFSRFSFGFFTPLLLIRHPAQMPLLSPLLGSLPPLRHWLMRLIISRPTIDGFSLATPLRRQILIFRFRHYVAIAIYADTPLTYRPMIHYIFHTYYAEH
jgi:hypothetical protein